MKTQHLVIAIASVLCAAAAANAEDHSFNKNRFAAKMQPTEEVPALSSPTASATFKAVIDDTAQTITYTLTYTGLSTAPTQAHIHVGQRSVNGGVSVFLCNNAAAPVAPACPASPATVTGVLTPANIIGPAGQGIAAGEFAELVRLIRLGVTYANVHSTMFPAGEARGQVVSDLFNLIGDDDD